MLTLVWMKDVAPGKGNCASNVTTPGNLPSSISNCFKLQKQSSYIVSFDVHTGKSSHVSDAVCVDAHSTTMTKTVLTVLQSAGLLDKGYRVYFDNYYTSPELLEELLYRNTVACGTVHVNHKGLPVAITKAKLKPGKCCFRRKLEIDGTAGTMLALKWCDKRCV